MSIGDWIFVLVFLGFVVCEGIRRMKSGGGFSLAPVLAFGYASLSSAIVITVITAAFTTNSGTWQAATPIWRTCAVLVLNGTAVLSGWLWQEVIEHWRAKKGARFTRTEKEVQTSDAPDRWSVNG